MSIEFKHFLNNPALYRKLYVVYLLTLLTLLTIKMPEDNDLPKFFLGISMDKWIHTLLFSPLVLGWYLAEFTKQTISILKFVFLIAIPFAAFCETLHYFIPYRAFSLLDFVANCAGISFGTILTYIFVNKKDSQS